MHIITHIWICREYVYCEVQEDRLWMQAMILRGFFIEFAEWCVGIGWRVAAAVGRGVIKQVWQLQTAPEMRWGDTWGHRECLDQDPLVLCRRHCGVDGRVDGGVDGSGVHAYLEYRMCDRNIIQMNLHMVFTCTLCYRTKVIIHSACSANITANTT